MTGMTALAIFAGMMISIIVLMRLFYDWFGAEQTTDSAIHASRFRIVKCLDEHLKWVYAIEYKGLPFVGRWRRLRGSASFDSVKVEERYMLLIANGGNRVVIATQGST